ncbi:hypothetical protein [Chondromyces crocatus]|uniref:Uncharacterized protein n=1 Tax=Chondromyces crocatus TaxID=52 RepID=A0A0K1ERJ5_CHOCO|nr:hypothetical protein [Chondromyces crocatus]AKT43550.1 uncharacterized protein CMC5_077820 [Chondromyces crocatus]
MKPLLLGAACLLATACTPTLGAPLGSTPAGSGTTATETPEAQRPPQQRSVAITPAPAARFDTGAPYRLNRRVYQVKATRVPLARTRCSISHKAGTAQGAQADIALVEWDPSVNLSPVRRISLHALPGASLTQPQDLRDLDVLCSAEVATYSHEKDTAHNLTYLFGTTATDRTVTVTGKPVDLEQLASTDALPASRGDLTIELTEILGGDPDFLTTSFSRSRSLDPLTPFAEDLLRVLAEVAFERAKSNAERLTKNLVRDTVCELQYAQEITGGQPLFANIGKASDKTGGARVFDKTCQVVEALPIESLASGSTLLTRALASDLARLAYRALERTGLPEDVLPILRNVERLTEGLTSGQSLGTERDVQALLLDLGALPMPATTPPSASGQASLKQRQVDPPTELRDAQWRCAIGAGIAVVRECLRKGECAAEQLKAELDLEFENPSPVCKTALQSIDKAWPELRPMLARAIDVFRPAPGTTVRQTAKASANILLDVIEKYPAERAQALQQFVPPSRALINSVLNRDVSEGAAAATGLVTVLYQQQCEGQRVCPVSVSEDQLTKGMALLSSFAAYAATYSATSREGEPERTEAELEALRHEERKKAIQSLIDVGTDRANRGGTTVLSLGASVGFAGAQRWQRTPTGPVGSDTLFAPQLSLPVGFALQVLPRHVIGAHLQLSLLDLGQYITVSGKDGSLAKPNAASAFVFGAQAGVLLGSSKYSVLLAVTGGYAPGLEFEQGGVGGAYLGGFAGTYVPFFDFN